MIAFWDTLLAIGCFTIYLLLGIGAIRFGNAFVWTRPQDKMEGVGAAVFVLFFAWALIPAVLIGLLIVGMAKLIDWSRPNG